MKPIKKTVQNQMEEINVGVPVRAILVNDIQNYLYENGEITEAVDINQNLEYSRSGLYIDIKYNGMEPGPDQELIKMITDDLFNTSGHKFTIE